MARLHESAHLSYAVRPRVVAKYLGQLAAVVAALSLVPLGVCLATGERDMSVRFAAVILFLAAAGALSRRLDAPRHLQRNEALAVTALAFVLASLLMAVPLAGAGLAPADAFFEAVSGITTTGLSTLASVEERSAAFLFTRAWLQWYGGLGIVVLSLGLALAPGVVARRLALAQGDGDDLAGSTRANARRICVVYLALTVLCVLALWLAGAKPFAALVHALATVSTGGFSSQDDSLASLGRGVQVAALVFAVACSMSLALFWHAGRGRFRELRRDLQWRTVLILGLASTLLLALSMSLASPLSFAEAFPDAAASAFSAQSTAGFSTVDVGALDPGSKLVLVFSMAIGGSTESTAGGVKVLRLLILLRLLQLTLFQTTLTKHAFAAPRLGGERLENEEKEAAMCVVSFFVVTVLVSWLIFVFLGYDALDALFEVVSATGTVGLSSGICGPELPLVLKAVLALDMWLGRLEMVALLVVLYPRTWWGRRRQTREE